MNRKHPLAVGVLALLLVPVAAANHDSDALPDNLESIACNDPSLPGTLLLLGGLAGSCVDDDYQHMLFDSATPGPVACDAFCHQDFEVLGKTRVFAGQDAAPVPLPPEDVPGVPVETPPVHVPVMRVQQDPDDPLRYCVTVVPEDGEPDFACFGVGPLIAPLLEDYVPVEQLDVPGFDQETPPVEEGEHGNTPGARIPAIDVEVSMGIHWAPDRLYNQATLAGGDHYTPINLLDPSELQWWSDNGEETSLELTVQVYLDDQPTSLPITIPVPYAGQVVAAALASGA